MWAPPRLGGLTCSPTGSSNTPAALWSPLPGPQTFACNSPADIIGYGGQAGGGKSDLLLGLAVTRHRRSIIFRREAKQGRSLIDRSRELLHGHARLNEVSGIWRGIPGDRQLEFAGVKDPHDVLNWRGQPHDFIGIDEADSFLEFQVRFLLGWLRTTIHGQRTRAVFCFNPPATSEGRWLLSYFAPWLDKKHPRPAAPGELRWFATLRGGREVERPDATPFAAQGETVRPKSRTFIPARVQDNPYLMATDYVTQLQTLPEPLRSQLLYGDFQAGLKDDPWQVIPSAWIEAAMERWENTPQPACPMSALGADIAYGGADQTVLSRRWLNWFAKLIRLPGLTTADGNASAAAIFEALDSRRVPAQQSTPVIIDAVGYGASAKDRCVDIGLNVVPVNFGEGTNELDASGKLGFANVRALAYWRMREVLDPQSGANVCLPPDPELLADLTAPKWFLQAGRIKIESKDDIKKRLKRSPDCGDAVVLANMDSGPADEPMVLGERHRGW